MRTIFAGLLMQLMIAVTAMAEDPLKIEIALIAVGHDELIPLALLQDPIDDFGEHGALLALKEVQTTGNFLNQSFHLDIHRFDDEAAMLEGVQALQEKGIALFVGDLEIEHWRALAEAKLLDKALFMNSRAQDNELRAEQCHANLLHTAISFAQRSDGLAQYLTQRRWEKWYVLHGQFDDDIKFAAAVEAAANKFRGEVVEQKEWPHQPGSRRTDSGHTNALQEVLSATQTHEDYDLIVVIDQHEAFGEYVPYRGAQPRITVGTHGLKVLSWSPVSENWGATQLQRRFKKAAGRGMQSRDYSAWLAVRSIGEAVTRIKRADWVSIRGYLLSEAFNLGAFKGIPVSFRDWNGQARQPVLLSTDSTLVDVAPLRQFLHERTPLDTLGVDLSESKCEAFGTP